jgi:uncharacterized protein YdhG (YjbR/CyaY superfamily)
VAGPSGVEAYLAAVPPPYRALLEELRKTIKSAAPDATETISYRMPAFKDRNGRSLVWYAAFKDHCSLFPATGAVMEALEKELQPYLSGKGTLRFTADRPMPARLVKRIVRVRLGENASRGRAYRGARTDRSTR